ncbi:hypothetical protein FRC10_006614 [Ceratobasidium sp. 414]|nr:hypothetical protein FRC10_006614 [Ceratobasidium sp. 414]
MIITPARPASPALAASYDAIDYPTDPDLVISTITSNMSSLRSSQREPLPDPEVIHSGPLKPTNKAAFTILLIGETGSGKTSFMSLLANLLRGNGPFGLQDYHDTSKESGLSKTQSQTTKATLYEITAADGTKFHILDTPGLADTRGIEQDRIHKEEINNAIQEFVSSIDAVIIMANGTVERLTVVTDYTLNIICSMFPRTIIDNIGFIFTNCDPLTFNFDHESLQPELRDSPSWVIQNPLAMLKNYNTPRVNRRFSANQIQKQMDQVTAGYDETVETVNEWLDWLDSRQIQTTIEIDRLYRISTDIESNIESALATITRLSEQREQYTRIRSDLHDAKKAKKALKDLEERETERVWDRQSTDEPNTICIASGCFSNCHAPCNMRLLDDYTSLGRWCKVFKNYGPLPVWDGASAVCKTCQHPSEQHRHYRQIHVQKTRAADPEKTRSLDTAETEEQSLQSAKTAAERRLNEIREDMISAQDTIRDLVESYNEISLSRNFAGHVRSAIQMLRLRKEELNTRPDTEAELQLIDESISKFEQQLAILAPEETRWNRARAILQAVRDNMPGAPMSPRLRPASNVNQFLALH